MDTNRGCAGQPAALEKEPVSRHHLINIRTHHRHFAAATRYISLYYLDSIQSRVVSPHLPVFISPVVASTSSLQSPARWNSTSKCVFAAD